LCPAESTVQTTISQINARTVSAVRTPAVIDRRTISAGPTVRKNTRQDDDAADNQTKCPAPRLLMHVELLLIHPVLSFLSVDLKVFTINADFSIG